MQLETGNIFSIHVISDQLDGEENDVNKPSHILARTTLWPLMGEGSHCYYSLLQHVQQPSTSTHTPIEIQDGFYLANLRSDLWNEEDETICH